MPQPSQRAGRVSDLKAGVFYRADRRRVLRWLAYGCVSLQATPLFAEQLTATARMTEGPFYPDHLPLDTDNDLLIINANSTSAIGEVTHLTGRVLSSAGEPLRNAEVEIWQVDSEGSYLHSGSARHDQRDKNFQGFGRFLTDSKGRYYFRTIKPVTYPGRTPHIHFAVNHGGKRILTTQMLIKGHPQNERDGVFRDIQDPQLRETILVDFLPLEGSTSGELKAKFNLVIGHTAEDPHETES
jgi:protocatechuate 3,4-dioxygenase, beta subunit